MFDLAGFEGFRGLFSAGAFFILDLGSGVYGSGSRATGIQLSEGARVMVCL